MVKKPEAKLVQTIKVNGRTYKTADAAAQEYAFTYFLWKVSEYRSKNNGNYPESDPEWEAKYGGYIPMPTPKGSQYDYSMTKIQHKAYRRVLPVFKKYLP